MANARACSDSARSTAVYAEALEDEIGTGVTHEGAQAGLVDEIDASAIEADQFAGVGKAALQLAANLTDGANDEDAAESVHAKTSASRREAPLRSLSETMAS